jgi:hypothetical protein
MGDVHELQIGWSKNRLADELNVDRRTLDKRFRETNVAPIGKRAGHDIYRMADAARAVFGRTEDEATANPRDLPPLERRAFYQSENERLKVEVATGALVPAPEVEADYASFVKLVAQFFDTLPDVLERDCGLTGEQVERIQEACDRVRQQMFEKVLEDDVRQSA